MTNEFAIKVLTELKGYGDKFANIGFDRKEALDMAIEALEQEPCEDCISRAEAIRHRHLIYDDDGIGYSAVMVDEILSLPSVTPKYTDEEIQKMQELEQAQLEKAYELGKAEARTCEDCRNCKRWDECLCGKEGHTNGTSIGYSIGECKDYEPSVTPSIEEWLSSFNTESAPQCFNAVQELKKQIEKKQNT